MIKKKKIGSFLLALVLLTSLMPSLSAGAMAAAIDESYNTGVGKGGGGGALISNIFSSAVVKNTGASDAGSGTAKSLEVEVELKSFGSPNSIYALVMKASDYSTYVQTSGGPKSAGIDGTSYFQQNKFDSQYYAIGRKNPESGTAGNKISLPLVVASTENASALQADTTVPNKTMPAAGITAGNYFDEYVLVVFSTELKSNDSYYVDHFYVDADGYVRTSSYLIQYNANNPAGTGNVTGTPARTITRALPGGYLAGSTTLSTAKPTRTGYAFQGWSETAKTASPDLTAVDADYAAGAAYPKPESLYTVNNLYAVWKTIPVAFATVGGSKNQTVEGEVRVGVTFSQTFDLNSAVSDGTKNYRVTKVTVDGTQTNDSTKFPNNIPAGMRLERSGTKQWVLSGTPAYDCNKPIVMTVEVTDQSNTTVDTMELTISQIEKGRQPQPDMSVNTGLASQMVDDGDDSTQDGQLIGFYSAGQKAEKDSANTSMTDGTGTYTSYYLSKGMIYEYRPKTEAGDGPWRAIPAPEGYYGLTDEAAKTAFKAALAAGSTGDVATTKVVKGGSVYTIQPVAAWDAAYGAIQFVDGLPVVAGLAKDAEYEVRFRENDTYDPSSPTSITIGGVAASSGPSGYSLIFNLMGGAVTWMAADEGGGWNPPEDGTQPKNPFAVPITVTAAGDVTIPALPDHAELTKTDYIFGGFTDGQGNTYQPGETFPMSTMSVGLAAVWISNRVDLSGVRTVTFMDWDNSTQLAVTAVNKGETIDPTAYATLMNTLVNENAGTFNGLAYTVNVANEGYIFNPNRLPSDEPGYVHRPLLTDKGGYTFVGWLPSTADKYHFPKGEVPTDELIDLNTYVVDDYVTLIACYEANSKCGDVKVLNQRLYTLYYETIDRTATNYTIEVTVSRNYLPDINGGLFPARAVQPVLKAAMMVDAGGSSIMLSAAMENQDVVSTQFTFPNSMRKVDFSLVEMNGAAIVNSALAFSSNLTADNSGFSGVSYIKRGTLSLLNERASLVAERTTNNIAGFTAASYYTEDLAYTGTGTPQAKNQKILQAWRALNEWEAPNATGENGLTAEQNPLEIRSITYEQGESILLGQENVYLRTATFRDLDGATGKIGGSFSPFEVIPVNTAVFDKLKIAADISGFKVYWSEDGLVRGEEVAVTQNEGVYSIAAGTEKSENNRFFMVCAVSDSGTVYPCSAVIPVWDNSQE